MESVNYCCVTQVWPSEDEADQGVPRSQIPVREYTKKTQVTWEIILLTCLFSLFRLMLAKHSGGHWEMALWKTKKKRFLQLALLKALPKNGNTRTSCPFFYITCTCLASRQPGCQRTVVWISPLLDPWQNCFFLLKEESQVVVTSCEAVLLPLMLHTWRISSMDSPISADLLLAPLISC